MVYELRIVSESEVQVRKLRERPQWESEPLFDSLEPLKKYLSDYVTLSRSVDELCELLNSAPMETWQTFL